MWFRGVNSWGRWDTVGASCAALDRSENSLTLAGLCGEDSYLLSKYVTSVIGPQSAYACEQDVIRNGTPHYSAATGSRDSPLLLR